MTDMTLQDLSDKLDHIATLTLMGTKAVLDIDETVLFTGLSRGHLYRLTSEKRIPHFKKCRKLYFKKSDLEEWMMSNRVLTEDEIRDRASTYVATHRRRRTL